MCGDAPSGFIFFFSSRRRHTRFDCDWSSDVCSSDLTRPEASKEGFHDQGQRAVSKPGRQPIDRKSTRLNSSHSQISYAVFCLKKKKKNQEETANFSSNVRTKHDHG